MKKGVLLFPLFAFSLAFSGQVDPVCKDAYYRGISDVVLFQTYVNSVQVPSGKWWVVIDVSNLPLADKLALAIELKGRYSPVFVQSEGKEWLLVYASDSEADARGVASRIGVAKAEVVERPSSYRKVEFARVCEGDSFEGRGGLLELAKLLKEKAKQILSAVEYSQIEDDIDRIIAVLKEQEEKGKATEILKELFGGNQQ